MKDMIIAIIAALIGIMVVGVSIYYLVKEKNDKESKRIYLDNLDVVKVMVETLSAFSGGTVLRQKKRPDISSTLHLSRIHHEGCIIDKIVS